MRRKTHACRERTDVQTIIGPRLRQYRTPSNGVFVADFLARFPQNIMLQESNVANVPDAAVNSMLPFRHLLA